MTPRPDTLLPPDHHGWFAWQGPFAVLLDKVRPVQCVEVGAWLGLSAMFTAEIVRHWDGHLVCVDPWGPWYLDDGDVAARSATAYEQFCSNVWHAGLQEVITPFRGVSSDAASHHPIVDWVYIDGSHEYADVVADLAEWWPRLRPGGVMLGDDYGMDGVNRAWNEWQEQTGRTATLTEGQLMWVVK